MIVAGVMSGTSADGINVALLQISSPLRSLKSSKASNSRTTRLPAFPLAGSSRTIPVFRLLAHAEYPYPKKVRSAVLATMNAVSARVADLARLNFLLGELYADAVLATQKKFALNAALVGCHGQTLYHQGEPAKFLGRKLAVTWQAGEGAVIAARLGVPVVSDFRPADMAAGGKGAPLVPYLDYFLYRDQFAGRIAQNIGGIANLTAIPAAAKPEDVIAFDTGPGNMLLDALCQSLLNRPFDRDGKHAARGRVLTPVLKSSLHRAFFQRRPPKTAGREEFGREFAADFLQRCRRAQTSDILATATALTACSIASAVKRFVIRRRSQYAEMIVSGGGAKNVTLMRMLAEELAPTGLRLLTSDHFGLPSEAKEAAAFALLAFQTWHGLPSNVPSATGAQRPAVLGKVSHP